MEETLASNTLNAQETQFEAIQTSSEVRNEQPNVISLEQLKSYTKGRLVRLPDFAEDQPFYARVRRPSMLALAKAGKIPNALLTSAAELFNGGTELMDEEDENMLADIYDICRIMAGAALVEPTLEQLDEIGLELTDEQLMAITSYAQNGINALNSFRQE